MSLLDTLRDHRFPPRGEMQPPTQPRPSTSTITTAVDMELVAACIRASSSDPNDPDPRVSFHQDDGLLNSLADALRHHLLPDVLTPAQVTEHLVGSSSSIRYDRAISEVGHYSLLLDVYSIICQFLFDTQEIYRPSRLPRYATWLLAGNPEEGTGRQGKTDLEVVWLVSAVRKRSGILWEYKRDAVLFLPYLMAFVGCAMRDGRLCLRLDSSGRPTLDGLDFDTDRRSEMYDHVLKWCCQVSL